MKTNHKDSYQVVTDSIEDIRVEVSFAEILKHGDDVEAGLGAGHGNVSVSAVHRLYAARLRHAVTDAN